MAKVRMVVMDNLQTGSVGETYAPVASLKTLRSILALAQAKDCVVGQMDVKATFLHANFNKNEEIYLDPPEGIEAEHGLV